MVGTSLQGHLAAADNATRNLFGEDRTELLKHIEKHGLQVTGMQIGSLAAHADRQKMLKDDDVRS